MRYRNEQELRQAVYDVLRGVVSDDDAKALESVIVSRAAARTRRSRGAANIRDVGSPGLRIGASVCPDHLSGADFNAVPWFAQASDDEILALSRGRWRNSSDSDAVAVFMATQDQRVAAVLDYARVVDAGTVCEINAGEALAWLAIHRPTIARRARASLASVA
ncbi:MAG: hypothetical protein C0497_06105 [Gemmatimonas sp.]|nr:hypothetical protein [Gemmatimonas sp.]